MSSLQIGWEHSIGHVRSRRCNFRCCLRSICSVYLQFLTSIGNFTLSKCYDPYWAGLACSHGKDVLADGTRGEQLAAHCARQGRPGSETGEKGEQASTRVFFVYIMVLLFQYIETSTIALNIGTALYQTSIVKTVTVVSRSPLTGVR